jgi:hypothetical protein
VVKVEKAEKSSLRGNSQGFLSTIYGTAEAVPFQNQNFTTGC